MHRFLKSLNTIRVKIFLSNYIVLFLTLFSIGWIAYEYTIDIVMNDQYERMATLADQHEEQFNQYLLDLQLSYSDISSVLADHALTEEEIVSFLSSYKFASYPAPQQLYYISSDGSIYRNGQLPPISEDLAKQIYENTVASALPVYSTGPYHSSSRGTTITLSMSVRKGAAVKGVLASDLNLSSMNAYIAGINIDERISMLLLNRDQQPIVSDINIPYAEYASLLPKLAERSQSLSNQTGLLKNQQEHMNYLTMIRRIHYQDWTLVYFVNQHTLLAKIQRLKEFTLYFAAIMSVLIALMSYSLARYIENPIKKLIFQINTIKKGILNKRVRLHRRDEFLSLEQSFNQMLEDIERLISENSRIEVMKRQYELKALQAQINPHFLYNTLNSINSLLDLRETDKIPTVIDSLVQLFQYTMDKDHEWTTIRNELKGLEHYVRLLQIRYENKFDVHFKADESILDWHILKLTLQPIVENAIFHGITEKKGRGNITIGGTYHSANQSILMFVEDDGIGIPADRLSHLLEDRLERSMHTKLRGYNSIGLKNVHDRLRLHFGEAYGLKAYSEPGQGTRVEIHLPALNIMG